MLVLAHDAQPSAPLVYDDREVMATGYPVTWFLFQGCGWDIGCVRRPDGTVTGYYVDVLLPVHWTLRDGPRIEPLVDLFLDLWIAPDGDYQVLDEDEYAEAVRAGWLTVGQREWADETLIWLIDAVQHRQFPPAAVADFQAWIQKSRN